jgi:hypothetical protein
MLAGGLPMDFPTISIHESFSQPNSMFLRNLMSMDTEELLRAQPMDAVVLIGGCDKTVPAQLMGAASAGLPAVQLITGSMLTGSHRSERVGACTDCRRYWGKFRAEEIDAEEIAEVNKQLVESVGTCSVMGTASTMACIAEALGMTVPGGASPTAVTADRMRIAEQSGTLAVEIARKRLTIDKVLTEKAFENAMRVLLAAGYVYVGMDHFALPTDALAVAKRQGRLHRNFQGYSTQPDCDLIALGVSSIGRVGPTFSQNVKTLDEYYDLLNQGRLPVARGMALTRDDLVRRTVIMALMCQGSVLFESVEVSHLVDFKQYFATEMAALTAMQDQGLLTLDDSGIQVTELGWFFVRGVAMVFDKYLQANQNRARFSKII